MSRPHYLVLIAYLAYACGDDGGSSASEPGSGPIAEAELPDAMASAWCAVAERCCSAVSSTCEAETRARVLELLDGLGPQHAYDPDAARACVTALVGRPASCADVVASQTEVSLACAPVVNGTIEPGQSCESVEHCRREATMLGNFETGFVGCLGYGGDDSGRCRQFRPTSEVGTACASATEGEEAVVNTCAGDTFCSAGQCASQPRLGDACPDGQCHESFCAADQVCDAFDEADATCLPGSCAIGLDCRGEPPTCQPAPLRLFGPCLGFSCIDAVDACDG